MSVVYRDLTIDCTKNNFKSEKVTGYEHGVKVFRLKPLNGNIPIDLSDCTGAAYVGTKSDGKIIGNACEIKDNKILLPLTLQMTTAMGDLKGHIEVYFPTGTLKFFGVDFEVFPSPETAEIESKDEFTLLENAIAQAKNAYQIAVENGFVGTESEWLASLKGENGVDGKDGIDGQDGKDGADGIGITSTEINASGELVLTYSDGSTANVGAVKGKDGTDYVLTESDKQEIAKLVEVSSSSSDKWELINTVEVKQEVNVVSITKDQSGNPFKLKKIRISGQIKPCVEQKASNYLALGLNSNTFNLWNSNACKFGGNPIATDTCENFILIGEIVGGYFSLLECQTSQNRTNVTMNLTNSRVSLNYPEQYQIGDAIAIGSYLKCIGIGSTFKIWGVKDNE